MLLPIGLNAIVEQCQPAGPINANVELFFDGIAQRIVSEIRTHDYVVGNIAWVRDRAIMVELSHKLGVSMVVTSERSLFDRYAEFDAQLALLQASVKPLSGGYAFRYAGRIGQQTGADNGIGIMHQKFAVLWKSGATPTRCLVGSYNWTYGSRKNRELLMVIDSAEMAEILCAEHDRVLAISRPISGEKASRGKRAAHDIVLDDEPTCKF